MKKYNIKEGVVCGRENNEDLFIRKKKFKKGYTEKDFHYHLNSFEFYVVLSGELIFYSEENKLIKAKKNSIIYFKDSEKHKITEVLLDSELLLIKKIESEKM